MTDKFQEVGDFSRLTLQIIKKIQKDVFCGLSKSRYIFSCVGTCILLVYQLVYIG